MNTPELTPRVEKVLDLEAMIGKHGKTDVSFLTNAKLCGEHFTSVAPSGWELLELFSLDLTENLLNMGDVEVLAKKLELLELAFNEMRRVKIRDLESFASLQYLDVSWNYLAGESLSLLAKLSNLKMLNISSNKIHDFKLEKGDFKSLVHLKMISNKLRPGSFIFTL